MIKENSPEISIIIPVYNVQEHIYKCIKSVKAQTFTNFEVLIVNDGTTDQSINLAIDAIDVDTRFKIFNKKNGGQGSARNLGIKEAKGKYIAFVDSDDWIEPNYLKLLHNTILNENSDICVCNTNIRDHLGNTKYVHKNNIYKYIEKNDILNLKFYISNWVWDKLYRKEVFNDISFNESIKTFEDAHLMFRLLYKKKISQYDEKPLYNYVQHPSSTSHSIKETYLIDRKKIWQEQKSFSQKINLNNSAYLNQIYFINFFYGCAFTIAYYSKNYPNDVKKLRSILGEDRFTIFNILKLFPYSPKHSLSALLFKFSPSLFKHLIKFLYRKRSA